MESKTEHPEQGDDLHDLRNAAIHVVRKLVDAGFIAYFAGGCVRDRLMGHEPTDYDVATSATPADVKKIFPRVQTVGESFGVMLVRIRRHVIQVATFRTEGVYSDGRHPDSVSYSDAEHDATRRDFTINGLFENPLNDEIIDYVGGRADLKAKLVRAIGDPDARLREDRLRMLRAVRFAARFGFSLDPATADAIRTGASHLQGVSRERIGQEVKRMLSDRHRAVAAWELQSLGLDQQVLNEPSARVPLTRLGNLPEEAPYATALAAWIVDRHGSRGAVIDAARRWAAALMLSNDEREALLRTLQHEMILEGEWDRLGVAKQKRLASSPHFDQALMLLQAGDRERYVEVRKRVIELGQTGLAPTPLIDGSDLIGLGFAPGPMFSRVLESVYDAQLEGTVTTRKQAVELANALARNNGAC